MSRQTPILLTPGPITVSQPVMDAMCFDHNPGDGELRAMLAEIQRYVLEVGNALDTHHCVPLQGSATFGVEAALFTCVPPDGKVLVVNNGFYGVRSKEIIEGIRLKVSTFDCDGFLPPDLDALGRAIDADPEITHVFVCHCETGSGTLNPAAGIAELAKAKGKGVIVDAIAAYGAMDLDVGGLGLDAVLVSPNKCFEGVPGMAIPVIRKDILEASEGRSPSYSLDLYGRWRQYEDGPGHMRFTPVGHVIAALHAAIEIHRAEGGVPARRAKYERNWSRLVNGLRQQGIRLVIPDEVACPIIATFHRPSDPAFDFPRFFQALKAKGFWIFNGKLTAIPTFRIGCMGDVSEADMGGLVQAVAETLEEMGVRERGPAGAAALAAE